MFEFVSVFSFGPGALMWPLCLQGSCVNLNTLDRVSPLHGACVQGHTGCAKLLVENGANVSKNQQQQQRQQQKKPWSSIHWLVTKCQVVPGQERRSCLRLIILRSISSQRLFNPLPEAKCQISSTAGYSVERFCVSMWKSNQMGGARQSTPTGWHVNGLQFADAKFDFKTKSQSAGIAASLWHFLQQWRRTKCSFISEETIFTFTSWKSDQISVVSD